MDQAHLPYFSTSEMIELEEKLVQEHQQFAEEQGKFIIPITNLDLYTALRNLYKTGELQDIPFLVDDKGFLRDITPLLEQDTPTVRQYKQILKNIEAQLN